MIVDGQLVHPRCVVSAEYAGEVRTYLVNSRHATRSPREHPLLSLEEGQEMIADYLAHIPARVFASKLEQRDLDVFSAMCVYP